MSIRKRRPAYPGRDSLFDVLTGEIRAKWAVRVGKSATDVTPNAGAAGHDLGKFGVRFHDGLRRLMGKRVHARLPINWRSF
jgi:hypothetical protein